MKTCVWLNVLVLSAVPLIGADVRNVSWGMTPDEVFAAEAVHRENQLPSVPRSVDLAGRTFAIWYAFEANRLWQVSYSYYGDSSRLRWGEAISLFATLRRLISEKYGPGVDETIDVKGDESDDGMREMRFMRGDLILSHTWETGETVVELYASEQGMHLTYSERQTKEARDAAESARQRREDLGNL